MALLCEVENTSGVDACLFHSAAAAAPPPSVLSSTRPPPPPIVIKEEHLPSEEELLEMVSLEEKQVEEVILTLVTSRY